ncbi:hypothetical protein SAMN05216516_101555 [Izhakiella capsodis]|uniref:Uncharacterized protein n=1 Tax=Izhakiella capsodis TaxID=1367852 RepID=A0A1I4V569_9GAMM|nr:hypothetical protein SAMN05216516_101555 [Izhakiella capsodis]
MKDRVRGMSDPNLGHPIPLAGYRSRSKYPTHLRMKLLLSEQCAAAL